MSAEPLPLISRSEARRLGLVRYFTGVPCKRGHVAERNTAGTSCLGCLAFHARARYAASLVHERALKRRAHREASIAAERALHPLPVRTREEIPELEAARKAKERAAAKERQRQLQVIWKAAHRKEQTAAKKRRRAENLVQARAREAAYRAAHVEEQRKKTRAWKKVNPEKKRAQRIIRDARKRGAEGSFSADDVARILKAQKNRCAYCKRSLRRGYDIDHIKPLAKGGSNMPSNLQATCGPCNYRKGATDPIEFANRIGLLV